MGSTRTALQTARAYLATLTGLPLAPRPGDPGDAQGLASLATVAPLNQNASVSLRWAGTPEIVDDPQEPSDSSAVVAGKTIITRAYSAPRATLRVFVDIRHGHDETAHLASLETLTATFPGGRNVPIGGTLTLSLDAGTSETQGDVYRTTFTGRLEFDWLEAARPSDVATQFNGLIIEITRDPSLADPVLETITVTE